MGSARKIVYRAATIAGGAALAFIVLAAPAAAEPATPAVYPTGSTATWGSGLGFDTCSAPSIAALRAWQASSYRTLNIYFSGVNRACTQPNLTASWVRAAAALGWRLLPTYFGRQPPCAFGTKPYRYAASNAGYYGTVEAKDAAAKAAALGLLRGSALYADVEHYDRANATCVTAVRSYVSAWTKTLHSFGYLAGVYVHQDSGLRDLSAIYNSSSYARPDAVWMARWDGNSSLTNWPSAPNTQWAVHQRAKQFRGDHAETWGGVTLRIDSDSLNAPVASVIYIYKVISKTALNARAGPSTAYPVVTRFAPGAGLAVVCQTTGQKVGTTSVWERLSNGAWVSDYYVSTPSKTTFSSPLPKCSYPGQITAASLNARTGPGTSYPVKGSPLPSGSLAWVMCQKLGTTVGTTRVWDRIDDGRFVSDYYVSNRSNTSWSSPVPRCP